MRSAPGFQCREEPNPAAVSGRMLRKSRSAPKRQGREVSLSTSRAEQVSVVEGAPRAGMTSLLQPGSWKFVSAGGCTGDVRYRTQSRQRGNTGFNCGDKNYWNLF